MEYNVLFISTMAGILKIIYAVLLAVILHSCVLGAPVEQNSVPGEYIVQLGPDLSADDVMTAVPGSSILRQYKIGSLTFALVKIIDQAVSQSINIKGTDIKLSPNRYVHGFAASNSSTECYTQESGWIYWGLSRISHVDLPDYDVDGQYFSEDTGQCVTVYVMDTGVNVYHETFRGRAVSGYTVAALMASEGPTDMAGHGTHVAGLAAGSTHGTAKHANVVSVKVLDQFRRGQTSWILEGFEWIANNINDTADLNVTSVINLSLGLLDPGGSMDYLDDIIREIPAVSVSAAGDEDDDACRYVPARFDSVITVGATTSFDRLPIYTNYGPCVDVLAPGHNIISASHRNNTSERQDSGTSMAAGFVSGVVARYLQSASQQPSTSEMRALLQSTASVNKTNAGKFGTLDLLVFAACGDDSVPSDIPAWSAMDCFPHLSTSPPITPTPTPPTPPSLPPPPPTPPSLPPATPTPSPPK